MAITNGYCTLAELKHRLDQSEGVDWTALDDAALENAIEAASRWIDRQTGRRFFATTETRYYTPDFSNWLAVDDLLTVTTLKTDDGTRAYATTWASGDYDLMPFDAPDHKQPYTEIQTTPSGNNRFPKTRRAVEIAGSFGYATTAPDDIKEACLLASMRYWLRKDAVFGVAGAPAMGVTVIQATVRNDVDLQGLLEPFKRSLY